MKKIVLLVGMLCFVSPLLADTPIRETRSLTLTFASEADAQNATVETTELPAGKSIALSSRWDDTNNEHLHMTRTLAANGWKGTFYLNSVDNHYAEKVVRVMKENGCSVGAHTNTHPWLGSLVPNAVWREIVSNRVLLESSLDMSVTTFTFPFSLPSTLNDPDFEKKIGEIFRRSGILGAAEPIHTLDLMGLSPEEFTVCYLFRANDNNPDKAEFDKGFQHGFDIMKYNHLQKPGPFFVLGVHSWQRKSGPDGFDRLGKILATQSHNPQYWYCNVNEYVAYRTNFKNAKIQKQVRGKSVHCDVACFSPAVVGAAVPLGLKITPLPQSVTYRGKQLAVDASGCVMVPCDDNLPVAIGRMEAANQYTSEKFPGLTIRSTVDMSKNCLTCIVEQKGCAIQNLVCTLRLPLHWKQGTQVVPVALRGAKTTVEFPLGERDANPAYAEGGLYLVNQCDFTLDGKPCRVYSVATVEQPRREANTPRDTAMKIGVCSGNLLDEAKLIASSGATSELIPLGDKENAVWKPVNRGETIGPYVMEASLDWGISDPIAVYAIFFRADAKQATPCTLRLSEQRSLHRLYLNGKAIPWDSKDLKITAQPGVNRLIVVLRSAGYSIRKCEIRLKREDGRSVEYVSEQTR
ncbi:MAG: polysaccharide deacetylase family protein [Planctomycetia bacterium]|nr:polysaccharide deacetylase family protein [Planctomycetia bacterium]